MTSLERLTAMGFIECGEWVVAEDQLVSKLLNCADAQNILYAFVVDDTVMYIGKTVQSLRAALSTYLMAEDLALRQLEADFGGPIEKQVVIASPDSRIMLDGLIRKGSELIAIEVKYVRSPHRQTAVIREALYRFISLGTHVQNTLTENQFRFVFVFVTEFSGEELETFKSRVVERFIETPISVDWRFFPFAELKEKFGIADEKA